MSEQVRVPKSEHKKGEAEASPIPKHVTDPEAEKARTEALLDEIDDILGDMTEEESAADFVAAYKQKGGE